MSVVLLTLAASACVVAVDIEDAASHASASSVNEDCFESFALDAENTASDVAAAGGYLEVGGPLSIEATALESLLGLEP